MTEPLGVPSPTTRRDLRAAEGPAARQGILQDRRPASSDQWEEPCSDFRMIPSRNLWVDSLGVGLALLVCIYGYYDNAKQGRT